MSKYKWIAQDECGEVHKYLVQPYYIADIWLPNGEPFSKRIDGSENPNWGDTLINLETEDYEIVDGILKRLPRKTELDKLIARVKLIDKKAAKWINKNRDKCCDSDRLRGSFRFITTPQGHDYWLDIDSKLNNQPTPQNQTIRYRVSLHRFADIETVYPLLASSDREANDIEGHTGFDKWLTDWVEVEINDE